MNMLINLVKSMILRNPCVSSPVCMSPSYIPRRSLW